MTQLISSFGVALALVSAQNPLPPGKFLPTLPDWTARIEQNQGWTGGDGCHSFSVGPDLSLWLFADSWVGRVEGVGKDRHRATMRMVNQAVGLLNTKTGVFQFILPENETSGFWKPDDPQGKEWYWPADGLVENKSLILFLFRLAPKPDGAPGFAFRQVGVDCVRIPFPREGTAWDAQCLASATRIGATQNEGPMVGSAVACEGEYVYSFTQRDEPKPRPFTRPMGLARVPLTAFSSVVPQQKLPWRHLAPDGSWTEDASKGIVLLEEGASEMSLRRAPGGQGWILLYTQLGMGDRIVYRQAPRVSGPWSEPKLVGLAPPEDNAKRDGVFQYSAKIHPEVLIEPGKPNKPGECLITWCANSGDLGVHKRRPGLYNPRFGKLQIRN